jgi:hypothetical protein
MFHPSRCIGLRVQLSLIHYPETIQKDSVGYREMQRKCNFENHNDGAYKTPEKSYLLIYQQTRSQS